MRIHKRTAVAVSGLVFGGAAALMVGSAGSAEAATVTASPHVAVSKAACRSHRRCRGSRHSSSQKVVVVNHNTNISRSSSNQFQGGGFGNRNRRHGFGHFGRGFGGFGGFGGFDDFDGGFGGFGFGDDWD